MDIDTIRCVRFTDMMSNAVIDEMVTYTWKSSKKQKQNQKTDVQCSLGLHCIFIPEKFSE